MALFLAVLSLIACIIGGLLFADALVAYGAAEIGLEQRVARVDAILGTLWLVIGAILWGSATIIDAIGKTQKGK